MTSRDEPTYPLMMMRLRRLLGTLALVTVSAVLAITAADLVVRVADLNFQPINSRANEDAVLDRREFRVRVVTNSLGFRDPRLPSPKPHGTFRVVILGDSFTQGYGVNQEESYPRLLEHLLDEREPARRHEVVNLGVPGACPLDYVAHLEDVGLAYEPDLVVVGFMANDVNDIYSKQEYGSRIMSQIVRRVQEDRTDVRPVWKRLPERLWPSLYEYAGTWREAMRARQANAGGGDATQAAEPPRARVSDAEWRDVLLDLAARFGRRAEVEAALRAAPAAKLDDLRLVITGQYQYSQDPDPEPMFRLGALLRPRTNVEMVMLPPSYDVAWAEATGQLRRIHALARGAGAGTMIVFAPAAFQVSPEAWQILRDRVGFDMEPALLTDTTMIDRLRAFGASEDIPVVDLLAPLRARRHEPLYFPIDGHWTRLGHEVAARELAAAILAR